MTDKVNFLDLDAFEEETPKFVFKYKGNEFALKQVSVADFIKNTKKMQKMKESVTPDEEMEDLVEVISEAFDSPKGVDMKTILKGMPLANIKKIMDWAFSNNGVSEVTEGVEKEGKPEAGE